MSLLSKSKFSGSGHGQRWRWLVSPQWTSGENSAFLPHIGTGSLIRGAWIRWSAPSAHAHAHTHNSLHKPLWDSVFIPAGGLVSHWRTCKQAEGRRGAERNKGICASRSGWVKKKKEKNLPYPGKFHTRPSSWRHLQVGAADDGLEVSSDEDLTWVDLWKKKQGVMERVVFQVSVILWWVKLLPLGRKEKFSREGRVGASWEGDSSFFLFFLASVSQTSPSNYRSETDAGCIPTSRCWWGSWPLLHQVRRRKNSSVCFLCSLWQEWTVCA